MFCPGFQWIVEEETDISPVLVLYLNSFEMTCAAKDVFSSHRRDRPNKQEMHREQRQLENASVPRDRGACRGEGGSEEERCYVVVKEVVLGEVERVAGSGGVIDLLNVQRAAQGRSRERSHKNAAQ